MKNFLAFLVAAIPFLAHADLKSGLVFENAAPILNETDIPTANLKLNCTGHKATVGVYNTSALKPYLFLTKNNDGNPVAWRYDAEQNDINHDPNQEIATRLIVPKLKQLSYLSEYGTFGVIENRSLGWMIKHDGDQPKLISEVMTKKSLLLIKKIDSSIVVQTQVIGEPDSTLTCVPEIE